MSSRDSKDLRERAYVARMLLALGENPDAWSIASGDRPDVIARSPDGQVVGIEVTEILLPEHGKDRNYDWVASAVHRDVVEEWVTAHGGSGAFVHGTIERLPVHQRQVEPIRAAFAAHLQEHGAGLQADRGEMWKPFEHEFGRVACIQRWDGAGFTAHEESHIPLAHKADIAVALLESMIVDRVREKVRKATGYDLRQSLWLLLRNRYQPLSGVSDRMRGDVLSLNGGVFDRVLLLNDREDHLALGIRSFPGVLDLQRTPV